MASQVTAYEAKNRFGQLLERVARGEEVIITKHDKPVARLIPEGRPNLKSIRSSVAALRKLRGQIVAQNKSKPDPSVDEIRKWIEEGRR